MVNGVPAVDKDGRPTTVNLVDFGCVDKPETKNTNIFRVVNQFTVEYMNNGVIKNRRPDVLLYVNGIPVCVIELKNPADANATIEDAWEQINIRYWRDIPGLLHYCPLACISDGVKTRLGTVRTPYEHFYAWRRVENGDKVSTMPFDELETMVRGVYRPERFWRYSGTMCISKMRTLTAMKRKLFAVIRSSLLHDFSVRVSSNR